MITLAEVVLMLPDLDGELQSWIDRWLPLEAMRDLTHPVSLTTNRPQTVSGNTPGVGLTLPNYPEPPECKLNTLYWPTGATRWARGYFLCHQDDLTDILAAAGVFNNALTLVMTDEQGVTSVRAPMYLLPPRPLSAVWPTAAGIAAQADGLYLLPLVDARYFWQNISTGGLSAESIGSWSTLFTAIGLQLGVAIATDAISANYYIPDPQEMLRKYENIAVLLDAAAHSVGKRLVRQTDGTVEVIGPATSAITYTNNVASGSLLMGGSLDDRNDAAIRPASVSVTFQKYRECAVDPNGDPHVETIPTLLASTPGTSKVIHSTAFADYSTKGVSPDNAVEVNYLATQIATDFYLWLEHNHDLSLPSLREWVLTGYEDHVEWHFGNVLNQQYQAYTRVHGRPYNFGDEEQLQQFPDMPVYPPLVRFKLTETLLPGDSAADAVFVDGSDGETATTDVLHVYDTTGRGFGQIDEIGWAEYKGDSLQWEFVCMEGCLTRHGIAQATIPTDNHGNFYIRYRTGGVETSSGITVDAWNFGDEVESGSVHQLWYEPKSQQWYVLSSGGGGQVVVRITSSGVGETDCLWDGELLSIEGEVTSACSDPWTVGDAVKVIVLDAEGGSYAGVKMALTTGEDYVGTKVGVFDGGTPVIAIRVSSQVFALTCPSPGVAAGGAINVMLPDGRTVSTTNWSDNFVAFGDKITVYKDRSDGLWYLISPATGNEVSKIYHAYAVDDIAAGATGTVTRISDSTDVEATNWSDDVTITAEDKCHVYRDPGDLEWYVIKSGGSGGSMWHGVGLDEIAPGDTGTVERPGLADAVEAINWNDQITIRAEDRIHIYRDPSDNLYYAIKGHDDPVQLYRFKLTSTLSWGDSASARIVEWDGAAWDDTGDVITVRDFTGGSWEGKSGYYGWCAVMPDHTGAYEIIWMQHTAHFTWSVLDTDNSGTVFDFYQGEDPGEPITVTDPGDLFVNHSQWDNADCLTLFDPVAGANILIQCETNAGFVSFRLLGDLGQGVTSSLADVDTYGGSQQDILDPGDEDHQVSIKGIDGGGLFSNALTTSASENTARGVGIYDATTNKYVPVVVDQKSFLYSGVLAQRMLSSDRDILLSQPLVPFGFFPFSQADRTIQSVQNTYALNASAGADVIVAYDASEDVYRIIGGAVTPGRAMVVKITSPDPFEGLCLWTGVTCSNPVARVVADACPSSNALNDGEDCLVMILDHPGNPRLSTNYHYLAWQVGIFGSVGGDTVEEGKPIYAIQLPGNVFHSTCPSPGVAAASSIDVTLYTGEVVSVQNWSDATINSGDRIMVFREGAFNEWVMIKSADDSAAKTWAGVAQAIAAPGATLDVYIPSLSTTISDVTNWSLEVSLANLDEVIIWQDPGNLEYYCLKAGGEPSGPLMFRGTITTDFTSADPTCTVNSIVSLRRGVTAPAGPLTVNNLLGWRGNAEDTCYFIRNDYDWPTTPLSYELLNVAWDVVSRVENVTYDSAGLKQQKRSFISKQPTADSPTLIVAKQTSDLVSSVTWTGTDLNYQYRTITYLGEAHSATSTTLIHTPTNQVVVTDVIMSSTNLIEKHRTVKVWGTPTTELQDVVATYTTVTVVTNVEVIGLDLVQDFWAVGVWVAAPGDQDVLIVDGTECPPP